MGAALVDIGAKDGEEARSLVAPGDPMVLAAPPLELAGGRVASRTLDNRAGVYVALETLRRAEGANVAVVAAAQEELGAHGAMAAAHGLRPDVAIAIDVTYATDVPADDAATGGHHTLGGGAAIFRGRRSTRASSSSSSSRRARRGSTTRSRPGRRPTRTRT